MKSFLFCAEQYIESVSDVIEYVKQFPVEDNARLPYPRFLYRGHKDADYPLWPSIGREMMSITAEGRLIEMARNKRPDTFNSEDKLTLLAKMQHYGLPTRLIDFTTNPLVALYFASQKKVDDNKREVDGKILVFCDHVARNGEVLPSSRSLLFKESWKIGEETEKSYQTKCFEISHEYYTHDFVQNLILSLVGMKYKELPVDVWLKQIAHQPWFEEWDTQICGNSLSPEKQCEVLAALMHNLVFVEAQETLERQRLQQGVYMLIPNAMEKRANGKFFVKRQLPAFYEQNINYGRMIVKAEHKEQILRELNLIGINEGFLFGDSIDHVCSQIKKSVF